MTLTLIITVITCILLILSIIKFPSFRIKNITIETFWVIALIGAIFILLTKRIPLDNLISSLTSDSSINPIKIIILLLSLSMLSITLDELGFFEFIASRAIKYVKNSQYKLFFIIFIMVAVLTVFTSNDIVILTFTLFICYFSKTTKINPIPYLVMEFVTANTCSMFLIIGNPTNIYISSAFEIGFYEYFKVMFLPTIVATITSLIILLLIFKKQLDKPININSFDEKNIKNKTLSIISLIHLLACTILLAISSYINLDMWLITLIFCLSLSIILLVFFIYKKENNYLFKVYKRLPYTLGIFVLSMFTIVLSLDYYDVTKSLKESFSSLSSNDLLTTLIYGFTSALSDNIINNIPMSLLYTSIISNSQELNYLSIYATIIGSNIGAFLTPIGALAGMMWMHILKDQDVKFSFVDFTKDGVLLTFPILTTSLLALWLVL